MRKAETITAPASITERKSPSFLQVFFILALLFVGLFHEFASCAASVALCIYLFAQLGKGKELRFYLNTVSVTVLTIVAFYILSILWATDRGCAALGVVKFFPLLPFLLLLMQEESTESLIRIIPPAASVITVVSALLLQIPALEDGFGVDGRLAGSFQYSNTYALFALVAVILIATKPALRVPDYIMLPVLIFGILYSGSRTVFALLVLCVPLLVLFGKNKKMKLGLVAGFALLVAAALIYAAITRNLDTIARFLTVSITESTFLGRILYFYDALPLIGTHPFGFGYMGYYFIQRTVQSGVYTVRFIHNEFLQFALDIGWIPALMLIAAFVRAFCKKGNSLRNRLVLLVVFLHSCFDFNLQFVAFFFLVLLFLEPHSGKEIKIKRAPVAYGTLLTVIIAISLYFGSALTLSYFKQYEAAHAVYPWNTENTMALLTEATTTDKMEHYADLIIEQNDTVSVACSAKARCAYSEGNFEKVIEYQNRAIALMPLSGAEYEDYCKMLIHGISLYEQAGDSRSAAVCRGELKKTVRAFESIPEKLSYFGANIEKQPQSELDPTIMEYVATLGE